MTTFVSPPVRRVSVNSDFASELERGAQALPRYENKAYYSLDIQRKVLDSVRAVNPERFDELIREIRNLLALRPYCVIIDGLPFDKENRIFVAINRAFGHLVARPYEAPRAQLVHYIYPAKDLRTTIDGLYETEKLHTDTADWEQPVDLISMTCVREDNLGGGQSKILDIDTLRGIVRERLDPKAAELLEEEPVPWQIADYRGGGVVWRKILSEEAVCWRRYTIDSALKTLNMRLSADMSRTLDVFGDAIECADVQQFSMCAGELMILDNHRAIHSRTPLETPDASDRLMIRSWIQQSSDVS